jgi:hypothetical protein
VGGDRDRQHDRALGAERRRDLGTGLDGRTLAGDDDLAWGIAVGDDEDAVRRGRGDELGELRVIEPDQGGHRAVSALAGRLHQATTFANEADPVGQRKGSGRDER